MPSDANHICVVIGRTRHKMMQAEINEAAKRGAQMIELRLDFLAKAPDFKRLLAEKPCPLVATARRAQDGGRWARPEDERRMLLRQAIVAGFDWVDLETDVAEEIRRFKNVKRIVSYHNLREVPDDLEDIHARMCNQDPDVVKIAVLAQHPADNLRLLDMLKSPRVPTVALCMGDLGAPTRVLAGKYGAPFTYAAFNKERSIAPGIPTYDDLKRVYHYESIDADTQVYGVIGDPVGHSLSPLIHNAAFRKLGHNAVYLPFRVPRGKLPSFLSDFDRFPVHGYSVTLPHKEAALAAAKDVAPEAALVQAVNTLVRGDDGFTAHNTDYQAALDSLLASLPVPQDGSTQNMDGKAVLVLGAGGVARAVAFAVQRSGGLITLANRTAERAKKLAEDVGCRYVDWEARHSVLADVLINCTSVGMHPNVNECPVHHSFLKTELLVFDTVYNPETTLLVKQARERGCKVLTGVDMFVRQAALQFQLFTGQEPPLDLMHTLIKRALSPVTLHEPEA